MFQFFFLQISKILGLSDNCKHKNKWGWPYVSCVAYVCGQQKNRTEGQTSANEAVTTKNIRFRTKTKKSIMHYY